MRASASMRRVGRPPTLFGPPAAFATSFRAPLGLDGPVEAPHNAARAADRPVIPPDQDFDHQARTGRGPNMDTPRLRLSNVLMLIAGLILGLALSAGRAPRLQAGGGDRSGESAIATGPIAIRYDEGNKTQIPHDALYYLDYKAGKLLATIPTYRQTPESTRYLEPFAERDLVSDFKIDVDNGPRPHFLMTTGQLGTFGGGWAPLFVFETTTSQVAVYRVQHHSVGVKNQMKFDLLELRPMNPPTLPTAASPLR